MSMTDIDFPDMTSDVLMAWYGHGLPADAVRRAGADIATLSEAFRRLAPPPFDLQAHHFAPLLETYADD